MARSADTGMRVEVAGESGFCFGVRRAIRIATETSRERPGGTVFSLGPLIHNPQEVARLTAEGLRVVGSLDEIGGGTIVIRSHGADPEVIEEARRRGIEVVDATCPLVKRAQQEAARLAAEGRRVLIVGDRQHPEVAALRGHCPGAVVIDREADVASLSLDGPVGLVAQTTESPRKFARIRRAVLARATGHVRVCDTICEATVRRQRAARELAGRVDLMIVLGGRNSANTARLAETCRRAGVRTLHVETAEEVAAEALAGCRRVGVTAGASTPDWLIDRLVEWLRKAGCAGEAGA